MTQYHVSSVVSPSVGRPVTSKCRLTWDLARMLDSYRHPGFEAGSKQMGPKDRRRRLMVTCRYLQNGGTRRVRVSQNWQHQERVSLPKCVSAIIEPGGAGTKAKEDLICTLGVVAWLTERERERERTFDE